MFLGIVVGGLIVIIGFIILLYFLYKKMIKVNSRANKNKGFEE